MWWHPDAARQRGAPTNNDHFKGTASTRGWNRFVSHSRFGGTFVHKHDSVWIKSVCFAPVLRVKPEASIRVIATRLHAYHHTHFIMCVCTDPDCSVELPSRDLKPCSAGQDENGLQRGATSEFMHVFVFIKSHTQRVFLILFSQTYHWFLLM